MSRSQFVIINNANSAVIRDNQNPVASLDQPKEWTANLESSQDQLNILGLTPDWIPKLILVLRKLIEIWNSDTFQDILALIKKILEAIIGGSTIMSVFFDVHGINDKLMANYMMLSSLMVSANGQNAGLFNGSPHAMLLTWYVLNKQGSLNFPAEWWKILLQFFVSIVEHLGTKGQNVATTDELLQGFLRVWVRVLSNFLVYKSLLS